eukprot:403367248
MTNKIRDRLLIIALIALYVIAQTNSTEPVIAEPQPAEPQNQAVITNDNQTTPAQQNSQSDAANTTSAQQAESGNSTTQSNSSDTTTTKGNGLTFWEDFQLGAYQSFVIIFLAELGDRTFIMVTLLASQVNKFYLFLAASMVMTLMHALSTVIGAFFAYLIPKRVVQYLVIGLFTTFGFLMLYKGCKPKPEDDGEDEKAEIQEQLDRVNAINEKREPLIDDEKHAKKHNHKVEHIKWYERSTWGFLIFSLMCQEWGDVSQIAAIGLAAKYGMLGVILGGALGHIGCILIALLLGFVVQKFCSERWLSIFSGILFLSFATMEVIRVVNGEQ